jgi:hypothetical protein
MCSFLVRRLSPAVFICQMESPNDHACWVCPGSWGFHMWVLNKLLSVILKFCHNLLRQNGMKSPKLILRKAGQAVGGVRQFIGISKYKITD